MTVSFEGGKEGGGGEGFERWEGVDGCWGAVGEGREVEERTDVKKRKVQLGRKRRSREKRDGRWRSGRKLTDP